MAVPLDEGDAVRDECFPLALGVSFYTPDLKFMARLDPATGQVVLYQYLGVDHREKFHWKEFARAGTWSEAAGAVREREAQPRADTVIDLTDSSPSIPEPSTDAQ